MRGLRVVTFCASPASSQQYTRMAPPAPDVSPINADENELIPSLYAYRILRRSIHYTAAGLAHVHIYSVSVTFLLPPYLLHKSFHRH